MHKDCQLICHLEKQHSMKVMTYDLLLRKVSQVNC